MARPWYDRALPLSGRCLFRGSIPPQPGELDRLAPQGWEVEELPAAEGEQWRRRIRHPRHGAAILAGPRGPSVPPASFVDWDPRLHADEREQAHRGGSALTVTLEPPHRDVLHERKRLLRVLGAVAAHDAVAVFDDLAIAFWSPSALDAELAHDAAVDISALFTMHLVNEKDEPAHWLHSHGLREVGFCEFDILEPHPEIYGRGYDTLRALASAIVEEALVPGGPAFDLVSPGGGVRLVSAREMSRSPHAPAAWLGAADDEHLDGHAVVCDGATRRFFGLFARPARPSTFMRSAPPEHPLIQFSHSASALMAARARDTYPLFRTVREELAAFGLPCLVKLGYPVEGGEPDDREHIWFEVHDAREDRLDATCINRPWHVASIEEGQRGQHDVELLSDWTIFTPFGAVNPRFQTALRELRARPDEARRRLQEHA